MKLQGNKLYEECRNMSLNDMTDYLALKADELFTPGTKDHAETLLLVSKIRSETERLRGIGFDPDRIRYSTIEKLTE